MAISAGMTREFSSAKPAALQRKTVPPERRKRKPTPLPERRTSPGHGPDRGGRGEAHAQAEGPASPLGARRKRQKCSFFSAPPQSADLRRRRVQGSRPCSLRGPERLETLRAGVGMQYPRKKGGYAKGGSPPLPVRAAERHEGKKAVLAVERIAHVCFIRLPRGPGPPHLPLCLRQSNERANGSRPRSLPGNGRALKRLIYGHFRRDDARSKH